MQDHYPFELPDFEQLSELARTDPAAFEAKRRELIDAALARVPAERRDRMRSFQWRLDQVRTRAPTPLSACMTLSRMMWDSVAGENGLLDALHGRVASPQHAPRAPVVRLPRRH